MKQKINAVSMLSFYYHISLSLL